MKVSRVKWIPAFCQLVDSFQDQFQRRARPGLLLLRRNIHPRYEGLVAFRNALAISSITQAWQNYVGYGSQFEYLKYSNYFDFYPYTLAKDEQWLLTRTASGFGGDVAEKFQGQTSPEITRAGFMLEEQFYEPALFAALLDRWVERYGKRKTGKWPTRALFRSLAMAYRASAAPQLDMYDFGAKLALWVSALEILVHQGKENIGHKQVVELLGQGTYINRKLQRQSYRMVVKDKEQKGYSIRIAVGGRVQNGNLLQKACLEMYAARNDFLHGNPVNLRKLFPAKNTTHLPLTTCTVLVCNRHSADSGWNVRNFCT